jgi:hypothetical protein
MPVVKLVRNLAVVLATVGVVMPIQSLQAGETGIAKFRRSAAAITPDVKKSADGQLVGRVVDQTGNTVEGAEVVVRQGKSEIGRIHSDKEGLFSVKDLKPGTYQISTGMTAGSFRVWNEKSAPPVAKKNVMLVLGENGARGQYAAYDDSCPPGGWGGWGSCDPTILLITAAAVAAVVISAITLSKVNDIQSKVDSLTVSP